MGLLHSLQFMFSRMDASGGFILTLTMSQNNKKDFQALFSFPSSFSYSKKKLVFFLSPFSL